MNANCNGRQKAAETTTTTTKNVTKGSCHATRQGTRPKTARVRVAWLLHRFPWVGHGDGRDEDDQRTDRSAHTPVDFLPAGAGAQLASCCRLPAGNLFLSPRGSLPPHPIICLPPLRSISFFRFLPGVTCNASGPRQHQIITMVAMVKASENGATVFSLLACMHPTEHMPCPREIWFLVLDHRLLKNKCTIYIYIYIYH